ncbi:MAG: 3-dehydroquinate synthase [Bacteroidales bacterium]
MEEINIDTGYKKSKIVIGESIANLRDYIPGNKKTVIITDTNIHDLYNQYMKKFPVIITQPGETKKTLDSVKDIYRQLIELEVDRHSYVVAVGGGIVCDMAGFAASTFLRGIGFGFVSTTLLSQVDASVGGKNGVNLDGYKNMIGVFNQPDFVICDLTMLQTLDNREYRAGFAEIIKAAAIKSKTLFSMLSSSAEKALSRDTATLLPLIKESVLIKAAIVNEDEKEAGTRKLLNFGHTFAHGIEKLTGIVHGEAVAIGMVMAALLSVKKKLLSPGNADNLISLIAEYNLPVKIEINPAELFQAMKKDKKRETMHVDFILLDDIGKGTIVPINLKEMEELIHDLC